MPFKWKTQSIHIMCPHCQNEEDYSVNNLDKETLIDEESEYKMGSTVRHIVHIDYHCPSCDTDSETNIEFIEYPIGCGECVNVDGDLIIDKTDAALLPLVDFSFQEEDSESSY